MTKIETAPKGVRFTHDDGDVVHAFETPDGAKTIKVFRADGIPAKFKMDEQERRVLAGFLLAGLPEMPDPA